MKPTLQGSGFDAAAWQGRVDREESGFAARWHQCIGAPRADAHGVTLLGFACDAGVVRNQGRAGAAAGPAALRRALAGIALDAPGALYDAGDVVCGADALETAQAAYAQSVHALLADGQRVIGLGGGHEIAFGSFCGLFDALQAAGHAAPRIGIVNFDAHFDLRADARPSSGTPFRQIAERCAQEGTAFRYQCFGISRFANTAALFERARALGVHWREDEDLTQLQLPDARAELQTLLDSVDHLYLTVCLDVLPPALAPGVSAPSARGIELAVLEPLLDAAVASGKLRLFDLAELNPQFDRDQQSARVAARLVARVARNWARQP